MPTLTPTPPLTYGTGSRSKIDSLATETLAHIFILGTSTESDHPDTRRDIIWFPVLVSHVCRRWRNVALNMSRLWGYVFVYGPFALSETIKSDGERSRPTCLARATSLRRIRVFLERSKSSPLTVYIDIRSPSWYYRPRDQDHPFTDEHMSTLLDYLLPYMDQWRDVIIICDSWAPIRAFLERCNGLDSFGSVREAKSLQRLALVRANAYVTLDTTRSSSQELQTVFSSFLDAPSLRHVTLAGVHIDWTGHLLQELTELQLKYHARDVLPTPAVFVDIINSSPNLENLAIHGWVVSSFGSDLVSLTGHASIRNLKQLSIGWVNAQNCAQLLALFEWSVPSLESISLEDITIGLDPLSDQDSSCVLDYMSARLRENTIECCPCSGPIDLALTSVRASFSSFRRFITGLPLLKGLTLHNVNDALLYVLDPLQGRSEDGLLLCPCLTRVFVESAGNISAVELQQMVRNREAVSDWTASCSHSINLEIDDLNKLDSASDEEYTDSFSLDDDMSLDGFRTFYLDEGSNEDSLSNPASSFVEPVNDAEPLIAKCEELCQPFMINKGAHEEVSGEILKWIHKVHVIG